MRIAVLAFALAACTGQAVPDRAPLPELPDYQPTQVFAPDPNALFPNDGTCTIASGEGALIIEVLDGFPAEDVLRIGDLIVEVEGVRTASTEALLSVMSGRPPGDTVDVTVDRRGELVSIDLMLQAADNDPDRGLMGIVPASDYSVYEPPQLPLVEQAAGPQRHVFVEEDLYLLDPLGTEWQLFAADVDADFATVAMGNEVYMLHEPASAPTIRALGTGEVTEIRASDWRFLRPLASIGGLILMSSVVSADQNLTTVTNIAVVAVDVATRQVVWEWAPGASPNELPVLAEVGYRSPAGEFAVVTLAEIPQDTETTAQRYHVLLDTEGSELSGWGERDRRFIPDNVVLAGFFDDSRVLYAAAAEGGFQVATFSLADGTASQVGVAQGANDGAPPRILGVGDGQHLLAIVGNELRLIDTARDLVGRPLVQNCDVRLGDFGFGA